MWIRKRWDFPPEHLKAFLKEHAEVKNGICFNKTTGKRIKACIPMHTFGFACEIDEIAEICTQYGIALIEDAAESLGTFYKGKSLGTFGKIGAISFNGNKIMTTGGGGMIITDDEILAKQIKHLTTQAKIPHAWEYTHDAIGYNFRMPNLNAALGLAQLEQLPHFLEKKRELAKLYEAYFSTNNEIEFKTETPDSTANYWLNAVILKDRTARDAFLEETNKKGVMTRPIWTLMNKMPMFEHCQHDGLVNSQWFEDRVVNIPSSVILDL